MRDIAEAVNSRKEDFASLKLMLLYVNVDKMLADAIGASATDETTVLFYYHSKSYKYRGRLRAQNILSSIEHYFGLPPEDVPLKHLKFPRELETFLESTDRSLLLLEFCGWTSKLLSSGQNSGNATDFGIRCVLLVVNVTSCVILEKTQPYARVGYLQCFMYVIV